MLRRRKILLAISLLLGLGSLGATGGYAAYLRSDGYRARTEADLAAFLNVPVSLGRVTPLSLSSRMLSDVDVFLPRRNAKVFTCRRVVWEQQQRDGRAAYSIDLRDGALMAGERTWDKSDYQTILQTGLGHDFASLGIGEIHLTDMDVFWRGRTIGIQLDDASGVILFAPDGTGQAAAAARSLNGRPVATPINIAAHFTPGAQLTLHEVTLTVPTIDLAALDLPAIVDRDRATGSFAGRVVYSELPEAHRISFSGALHDADLYAITGRVIGGPFNGQVDVEIEDATFLNDDPSSFRFRGRLSDLDVEQIVPMLQSPDARGKAELRVQQAVLAPRRIEYLSATGQAEDVSIEAVTRIIGKGVVTGRLQITVNKLLIEDDKIAQADLTLHAVPPEGKPGTIDRQVLINAAQQFLKLDISKLLPSFIQNVEYTRIGARLIIEGDTLRLRGTHGPNNDTLITVKLLGRDWDAVKAPAQTFAIPDLIALSRQHVGTAREEYGRVRDWWKRQHADE